MPLASLKSNALYYESTGEGPAVVFLHGAGGNHLSWWQQVPVFSDRYRCITIDHRGFGRSTDPRSEGATRFADDLEQLLDQLGVERSALVAQSMGGRTASEFTMRHPDRVWGLVMCDTLGMFMWEELVPRATELREERLAKAGAGGVILRGYMSTKFIESQPALTFLYQSVQGLNPQRGDTPPTKPATKQQVSELKVPALFLVGSEDPVVASEIVQQVHKVVPGSQFCEVPGAGHSVYWEKPKEFNAALEPFLAKNAPKN
jgi:3-oxoadipate enol-lactonase